jgi:hypothetical protein
MNSPLYSPSVLAGEGRSVGWMEVKFWNTSGGGILELVCVERSLFLDRKLGDTEYRSRVEVVGLVDLV